MIDQKRLKEIDRIYRGFGNEEGCEIVCLAGLYLDGAHKESQLLARVERLREAFECISMGLAPIIFGGNEDLTQPKMQLLAKAALSADEEGK